MTVGIGAVYNDDDEPAVVLVADRMVTTGAVEHENEDGKLEQISFGDPAVAAIAAGTLSYADELYFRVGNKLLEDDVDTVEEIAQMFVETIHEIVRDEANNQILSDFSLTLDELVNGECDLSDQVVGDFLNQVSQLKNEINNQTTLLLAGVDERHGAQLFEIRNGTLVRHSSLGYQCIGSGAASGNLTFMRNGYSPDSLNDALVLAADAKNQAGEAQGVGDKMDIAVVSDRVNILEESRLSEIQNLIDDVRAAEREARENTINSADIGQIR